ncbi:hypothetical protein AB3662_18155 [Sorangium cellulosum]|uniref:hypothetical protein n=1 Tax=Sorangium cellulosum TaxID=56 RepID=UPI003D9A53A4
MAQAYFVDFNNYSGRTWTMSVFQTYPDSVGLESVSWLQSRAADGGETGVTWEVDYQAMMADYKQEGGRGVYKASQRRDTLLGKRWKIAYEEGLQQLVADGDADRSDQIIIANDSGELAYPGIGMSGQGAVFKAKGIYSGSSAQFIVKPTYWVGLFNDVVRGEVISSDVVVGPQQLKFEGGMNRATVAARVSGAKIELDITYSRTEAFSLEAVDRHLQDLAQRHVRIEGDRGATNGTLRPGAKHAWGKNEYAKLSFDWADKKNPGTGTCSVKIGEEAARSVAPPQVGINVDRKAGSLTNNTDRTISYQLE